MSKSNNMPTPSRDPVQLLQALKLAWDRIGILEAENLRLLCGDFTPEEIHGFCHKLPATVSRCEFEKGCKEFQDKLYGMRSREDAAKYYCDDHAQIGPGPDDYGRDKGYDL